MKNLWKLGLIILTVYIMSGCAHKTATEIVVIAPQALEKLEQKAGGDKLHEVTVKQVVIDYINNGEMTPVVILANKENDRLILPIWVGVPEGISINMALSKHIPTRPGTHDLFTSVLGQFQMKLVKVVVTDMQEKTYFAMMTMEAHGKMKEIDARPSDAIAMALRAAAPIFVSEKVIHKSGWLEVPQQEDKQKETKKEDKSPLGRDKNNSI